MKGQGGGGTARGGGKNRSGGGAVKVTKATARQTKAIEDNIIKLRTAIFDTNGRDKNVTTGIAPAFMKYERNGLDVSIEFATKLTRDESDWAFDLCKDSMEERYDRSGYGWDDEDKEQELTGSGTRFLLVRAWPEDDQVKGDLIGFVHFRFTVQGEVIDKMAGEAQLYVYDIHIEDHSQRKGLGKHLLILLELIAKREKMSFMSIPVYLEDDITRNWLMKSGRGFAADDSLDQFGFDSALEGFEVYTKSLEAPNPKPTPAPLVEASVPVTATKTEAATETAAVAAKATASGSASSETKATEAAATESRNNKTVFEFSSVQNVVNSLSSTTTTTVPSGTITENVGVNAESDLTEEEKGLITQLAGMFAAKHGREATSDERALWIESIRSLDNTDLTHEDGTDAADADAAATTGDNDDDEEVEARAEEAITTPATAAVSESAAPLIDPVPSDDDWVHVEA